MVTSWWVQCHHYKTKPGKWNIMRVSENKLDSPLQCRKERVKRFPKQVCLTLLDRLTASQPACLALCPSDCLSVWLSDCLSERLPDCAAAWIMLSHGALLPWQPVESKERRGRGMGGSVWVESKYSKERRGRGGGGRGEGQGGWSWGIWLSEKTETMKM